MEKINFHWIFRDRLTEKSADLAEILVVNFAEKQSVKTGDFVGIFCANFARNQSIWGYLTSMFNGF